MIYSAAANAILYPAVHAAQVMQYLPDARDLGAKGVAVRADIRSIQILRLIGLPVPLTMEQDYDWPIHPQMQPRSHQKLMAMFLAAHPRAFNLSEMGTGKTLATLWAADYLMQQGVIHRCLVVAPLSTLRRVWSDEIFRHFMNRRKCSVLHGTRSQRLEALMVKADFYLINHDGLGIGTQRKRQLVLGDLARLVQGMPEIDAAIVDEGAVYKERTALRSRVMRQVVFNKPVVWWLTGTPTPTAPTDAWAQTRIVSKTYAEPFEAFRNRTMFQATSFRWLARTGAAEAAYGIMQPAIRFSRDECIELPEIQIPPPINVELSVQQRAAFDALKKDAVLQLAQGGQITAVHEGALRMKLIQVACGAVYDADHKAHFLDAAPRLAALDELMDEAQSKILVFAPLTSVVDMLYEHIRKRFSVEKVNGPVTSKRRDEIFSAFEGGQDPRVIVADPGTMAHGLNFPSASLTIWYGPTDKPQDYEQANARMARSGQKHKMLIARLASTNVEREIYRRLQERVSLQGAILEMVRGSR